MLLVALSLLAPSLTETIRPVGDSSVTVERRVYSMGTSLDIWVTASSRTAALEASERAFRAVERVDDLLSTWRPESPLQQIAALPDGATVAANAELSAVLKDVLRCEALSRGAFRLTPSSSAPALLRSHVGYSRLGDAPFDSGGFGKGYALDRAIAAALQSPEVQRVELDFGGQRSNGSRRADRSVIDLAHPRDRQATVLQLTLSGRRRSVATSATSERGAHLLDPSSGRPVADRGSFTVVASNGLLADCLSTGFYVLGREQALDLASRLPNVELLVLDLHVGRLRASLTRGLAPHLRPLVPIDLEVEEARGSLSDGGPHGATRKSTATRDRRRKPPAKESFHEPSPRQDLEEISPEATPAGGPDCHRLPPPARLGSGRRGRDAERAGRRVALGGRDDARRERSAP